MGSLHYTERRLPTKDQLKFAIFYKLDKYFSTCNCTNAEQLDQTWNMSCIDLSFVVCSFKLNHLFNLWLLLLHPYIYYSLCDGHFI